MTNAEPSIEIIEPLCAVFRRKLKAEGAKYTPERARVLDSIIMLDGLFDADMVIDALKADGHRVSKATVYRTIKLLHEAGVVQRVLYDGDHARYQLVYGRSANDLLVNLDTGEAIRIDLPELAALRDRIAKEHGLQATGHRLQIFAVKE